MCVRACKKCDKQQIEELVSFTVNEMSTEKTVPSYKTRQLNKKPALPATLEEGLLQVPTKCSGKNAQNHS